MEQYNPASCEHKLPNGFTAWQFQSEENSNLGGSNKVVISVCSLCGEISIGGYRPSKDETHTNHFHETFNIYHPDAIDAIIKQANFYNEEAKWGRIPQPPSAPAVEKLADRQKELASEDFKKTSNPVLMDEELHLLKQWKESAMSLFRQIDEYADKHPDIKLGKSKVEFVIDRARKYDQAASTTQGAAAREVIEDVLLKTEKFNTGECSELADTILKDLPKSQGAVSMNAIEVYELRVTLYRLLKAFRDVSKTDLQQKRFDESEYILNKNFDVKDVLRAETGSQRQQAGPKWVKASERLPLKSDLVHLRYGTNHTNFKLTGYYEPSENRWHRQDTSLLDWAPNLEWLDESQSTPSKEDAIDPDELWNEFSELIDDDIDSLTQWAGSTVISKENFKKLYDRFKKKQ